MTAIVLSDEQTASLRQLGDALAPASETMPSFSEADKSGRFLLRAFEALPHLAPLAIAAADGLGDTDPREYLERLSVEQSEMFSALHSTVVGAYLINRRVWRRLGYPGRKPTPVLDDEAEFYLEGGLLDPVIARGPIYRPTP
ncbi:MAG TPA: hypothetical protein VN880_21715 [Solirubrobacteraceae bacterium]|nr:hypothetical protein [Solirubrobacteraceae bacterium]